ncbi:hypothetical protein KY290_002477 [Solanum tuberosum]|uniref:Uncharacterized protein n=1 Tax=Solanum tuberosum TaxID=4113 RepID=A0ABQ7WSA3_SOLTU|nr:hypothetical protein KY289_002659 [Solanum tuberosum]KAH0766524.1 hypothetical protein KY285_002395 [Solanum tuberosum]KAH0782879.1 hypothetical protein KY290_002477 [Solanum tuberosum]
MEQQNGSNTMLMEESSNPTKNKDEGWHDVVKRRGKEIISKETPNGIKFTIDNNTTKVTSNFFNILQDKENGDMEDAEPSQVNLEEHDTSANQQNQVRSSRWDKAQKEKEGKASKRHQPKFNVRSTRSGNAASITNPEAELQGEMLSLVIKDPKDIKNIQNKRKKFTGEVSIPKEVTLQGEFRDDDGIIRKKEADQLTKWASLTNKMETREDTISQGANWKGEVNTENHGMYNKQEGGYNNNHEPPDKQHREPRERDEYEGVYHDVEVMETEFELTHNREDGQTMSDDEAIRGTNRSKS